MGACLRVRAHIINTMAVAALALHVAFIVVTVLDGCDAAFEFNVRTLAPAHNPWIRPRGSVDTTTNNSLLMLASAREHRQ